MKEVTAKRKRPRKMDANVEVEEKSKRRGRPRVDRQDETAAERRRTQIRIAQRAYRERKESTLDELRKRVSDLTNTLEIMNRVFFDCRQQLEMGGLSPHLSNELEETSIKFQQLMKMVRNPDEDEGSGSAYSEEVARETGESTQTIPERGLSARNVSTWMDASATQHDPGQLMPKQGGMGYTIFDFSDVASGPASFRPSSSFPASMQDFQDLFIPDALPQLDSPQLSISGWDNPNLLVNQPDPPRTYSFQETTFGRRLHRAALEAAYYLVLNRDRQTANFNRAFRLSLIGRDATRIGEVLKSVLMRPTNAPLELGKSLVYIGGAGTHYGRYDHHGVWQAKKTPYDIGQVGPQTLALLENAVRGQGTGVTVEIAGFEGVWFDPYDVEGYLRDQGVYIDPMSSFADVEVINSGQEQSSTTSRSMSITESPSIDAVESSASALPNANAGLPLDSVVQGIRYDVSMDKTRHNDMAGAMFFPGVGYSDVDTGSWMNFPSGTIRDLTSATTSSFDSPNQPGLAGMIPPTASIPSSTPGQAVQGRGPQYPSATWQNPSPLTPTSIRRKAVVDVNKLIKILLSGGVCLARTPGFRREDVERALTASIFEV